MKGFVAADVVREYLARMPKVPTRQLARVLNAKEPTLFPTFELARHAVRYARGERKNGLGKVFGHSERSREEAEQAMRNPFNLPAESPSSWTEYELPAGPQRWLIVCDVHVPFHAPLPITKMLQWVQANGGADGLLFLGDIPDFYNLSPWQKDPRQRKFLREVCDTRHFIRAMVAALRPKRIVWKRGNHDYRLERFLMSRAPELMECCEEDEIGDEDMDLKDFVSFRRLFKLDELGIDMVDHNGIVIHRNLTLLHGDEYGRGLTNPVNPARGIYLKAQACAVIGHEHRSSTHPGKNIRGTTVTCWSVGCLCDLHPEYRPLNAWDWGFAILDVGPTTWTVTNKKVLNNGDVV